MASRPLSVGWCLTLTALISGLAACGGGSNPPPPPGVELPDAALSKVEVNRTTGVLANGEDAVTITVKVVKSDGAALSGRTVRLTVTGQGNTVAPASGQTNPDGVLTATLVSTSAGTKQVTASVDATGGPVVLEGRPTVEFVEPPVVTASKMAFTTQPVDGTAGTALAEVRVALQDAAGNTVTAASSAVTLNLIGGPAFTPVTVNAVSGVATFSGLRIDTAGTGYRFEATSGSLSAVQSASFSISPAAAASLDLTGLAAAVTAGVAGSVEVTAHDAYGNVATGYTGTVKFTSTDATATLPAEAAFTAADGGRKTFSGLVLRTNGSQTVTVTDTATGSLTDSLTVNVVSGTATQLVLSVPATPVTAGSPFSIQVTLRDGSGNIAADYVGMVHFTSTDGQAVLPPDTLFTAADAGQKTFIGVELRTAGTQSITATDMALTDTQSVTVSPSAAASLRLTGLPASVTAGSAQSVQVTLRDSSGNIATGYTGTVHFTSTDAQAVLPPDTTFTAADAGQKTFTGVELRTAGSQSITAADTTLTDTQSATVSPAAAASLRLTGLPASVTAGSAQSVQVTLRDTFGNTATGYTGTVHFTSTDAQAVLPPDTAFTAADAGQKTFTGVALRTAGSQSITATDTALTDTQSTTVLPVAATSLHLTGLPGGLLAGSAQSVQVTLQDTFGNTATGYTGTVRFTSTDGQAVLPPDTTFAAADQGQKTFTGVELRTAGTQSITATDTAATTMTDTASTTVNANVPTRLVFSTQPANGNVRTTLAAVNVTIQDSYGNRVNAFGPNVTVNLTGGNTAAMLSGTLTVTPSSGVATFSDLSIDQEGAGFQLTASGSPLTGATSTAFNVTDNIAPAAAVISATQVSSSSVRVSWTAVGDDGNLGTAASYDLRYATSAITNETEFAAATPFAIPPPQAPGSPESAVVTGLNLSVDHYFALKVIDGVGNSSLSNSPRVGADLCAGVTCTPPASTCTTNGRGVVSYTSACVVSGGTPVCQDTPTTTVCQSYETCSAAACGPVTAASQAGSVIINEFSSLGAEFIELRNTTGSDIDVRGYTLRNAAGQEVDIRAPNDPNGTGSTPVLVPANGVLHGIANPSGSIPGGVGFVYGAPGTAFALADTGDALALYAAPPAGNLQDAVDFRSFVSNPNTPLTASNFVGFAGSSTQLDPARITAAANDTATNWCVSFYPSGSRAGRVTDTQGAANGSCGVAVINEILIDGPGGDDGEEFIEIGGPGGAIIGGAKITDIEGTGTSAGSPNGLGTYTIPAGTRIPADGILLIADTFPGGGTTVPNFVPGVDVGSTSLNFEDLGGDAYQLINAAGTALLDTVGQSTNGANLGTNTATNGFAMYETTPAFSPLNPSATWAVSIGRSPSSADTENNRNDFHIDPSPTPGLPNDVVNFTVTAITPDDTPAATSASTSITVTGTDLAPGMSVRVGTAGAGPMCTAIISSTLATCSVLPGTGAVGRVNLTFVNPANVGVPNVVLPNVFTYTGTDNETDTPQEMDYCNLQFPASFTVTSNTQTPLLFGRIYEAGVTDPPGAPAGILAEVGYGPYSTGTPTDPRTSATWKFFPANYNLQVGNDDEFMNTFLAPTVGTSTNFAYTFRFSQDNGLRWTYCDLDGAGSNPGLLFDPSQLGVMTVTP